MPRRRHRIVLLTMAGLVAATMTAGCNYAANASPSGSSSVQLVDTAVWQTKWGPLSAADRELISKVRLASLWEMPEAQQAAQRAQSPKVRQISAEIAAQHMTLDVAVRDIAQKLNVDLPNLPSPVQQGWMNDINSRSGHDYDVTYVKWLRFAHGQIYALIGSVRGSTQNTLMRSFADTGQTFVLNHMRLLESTGLVNANSFPSPPPITTTPLPKS